VDRSDGEGLADGDGDGVELADDERSPPPSVNRIVVRLPLATTAAGALGPSSRGVVQATAPVSSETAVMSSRSTTIASPSAITGAGIPAKCVSSPIPVGVDHAIPNGGAGAVAATPECGAFPWY
jgi:hypothetical protein